MPLIVNDKVLTNLAHNLSQLTPHFLCSPNVRGLARISIGSHLTRLPRMPLTDYDRHWCSATLTELLKWPLTQPFRNPVDPIRDGAKNYFEKIKQPMDLGTVKIKLSEGLYQSVSDFIDDLHLICTNAIAYNGENSMFAYIATDILTWVDQQYKSKPQSQEADWNRRLESIVNRLHEHITAGPPPPVPRAPAPPPAGAKQ
jgi:hypothetical protein